MSAKAGSNPYGYGQLNPNAAGMPYAAAKTGAAAGGKTLLITAIVIAAGVVVGMALGLGLGIGAAGLVSNGQLINVTNTTNGSSF
jgi:hypothetical protein